MTKHIFYITFHVNHQNKRKWLESRPMESIETPRNFFNTFSLVWNIRRKEFWNLIPWNVGKSTRLPYFELLLTFLNIAESRITKITIFNKMALHPKCKFGSAVQLTSKFSEKFIAKQIWPQVLMGLFFMELSEGKIVYPIAKNAEWFESKHRERN